MKKCTPRIIFQILKGLLALTFISLIFLANSCCLTAKKLKPNLQNENAFYNNQKCLITLHGLNSIVVDSSSFQDVVNEFGSAKICYKYLFKIYPHIFIEGIGTAKCFSLRYQNLGLKFWGYKVKNVLQISGVHLNKNCQFKTSEGVGIGTSFKELKKVFEKEDYYVMYESKKRVFYNVGSCAFRFNSDHDSAVVLSIDIR